MAKSEAPPSETFPDKVPLPRRRRWWRWLGIALLGLVALLVAAVVVLESPIGHRFIVDRIARYAPASGLRVEIGRIDGSLMGEATLRDVTFADPQGLFMRVPVVELDWRPLHWFTSGLDVRKLILRRGTLYRAPRLNPGDPNAPILPNFDIRVDRFELDRLTVAQGMLGEQRRIDLVAKADIRGGRVYLATNAHLGGADRLIALVDSEPDRDRFAIKLDYNAPAKGLLANLTGAKEDLTARIDGSGRWQGWRGVARVDQTSGNVADLAITNRGGRYAVAGTIHPGDFVTGIAKRATGPSVAVQGEGTLVSSVLAGRFSAIGQGADLAADGTVDLGRNTFQRLNLVAHTRDPTLLGPGTRIEGGTLTATLDGPFRAFSADHRMTAARFASGTLRLEGLAQQGKLVRAGDRWVLPLNVDAGRVVTGNAAFDPRLTRGHLSGTVALMGTRVSADDLVLGIGGIGAKLTLAGDTARSDYRLAGPVAARGQPLQNLGLVDADAQIALGFGSRPWLLDAEVKGRMARVDNATLTTLAGSGIRFAGHVAVGGQQPLLFRRFMINGSKLALVLDGRNLPDGTTTLAGRGRQTQYGPFTVQARLAGDGPRAELVFASPLPAAGIKDVHVALAPIAQGFRIETTGQSRLGPFAGTLGLFSPPGGPTRIVVETLKVWETAVSGTLLLGKAGIDGTLALQGGGVDGTIGLAPRSGGQGFDVALAIVNARFGGATPLAVGNGRIVATGTLADGHTTVSGNLFAEGLQSGSLFIGRLAANAQLIDGTGRVTASLSGRRGSRFNLQLLGDLAPDRYAVLANGDYAGQRIQMPRRAVVSRQGSEWVLAPTQIDFAGGRAIAAGSFGDTTRIDLAVADLPLALADVVFPDLSLGGKASGSVRYTSDADGLPTGEAQIEVHGLTRSGLVLTSQPVDLSVSAKLGAESLEARAVVREGGAVRGRLQGRIGGLPRDGTLTQRLNAGALVAQLRYAGPADALWRLAALETFDLTGPLEVGADVVGSLADPAISGSLTSSGLRLQSSLTGTDIGGISLRGTFAGSQLQLASFSGRARNGGLVSGSGAIDLSGLGGGRGPSLDLRLAARSAELIARDDMAATVTGPLRIVSDGIGGTIAGRLAIDSARWQLGKAAAAAQLPDVKTREINPRADVAPRKVPAAPWRYLVDARGTNRIAVRGLGLESEWGADIRIRGTTDAIAIFGRAEIVRGGYEFAGKRFELTKGIINFDGNSPPDPRLDIAATAQVTNLTANVTVTGTAGRPVITFTSAPALPEEELLSRLLFGSSITQISAPEAVQIGAALASLRGGGGLDPINKLRTAIGLDRLRIVGADAATGRGTSVAVGKYVGRRLYAEIVTDGRGYNATQLEYRVTRWLSILATISSIGRQGIDAKVSKDY
jgi:translocation and assembly module TamB